MTFSAFNASFIVFLAICTYKRFGKCNSRFKSFPSFLHCRLLFGSEYPLFLCRCWPAIRPRQVLPIHGIDPVAGQTNVIRIVRKLPIRFRFSALSATFHRFFLHQFGYDSGAFNFALSDAESVTLMSDKNKALENTSESCFEA